MYIVGLRSPGSLSGIGSGINGYSNTGYGSSASPCTGYWSSGGSGVSPCPSSNICCYPLVVQTTVESTSRPYSSVDTVTYPSTGYIYRPHGYKSSSTVNTLSPQASENDEIVDSST